MDENTIETISQKVMMLVSLSRILENTCNHNDDVSEADMWALVLTIKENLQDLLDYIQKAAPKTKISTAS